MRRRAVSGRPLLRLADLELVCQERVAEMPALQVFEVPGDHDSMVLEPNVRVLASRMKRVLEKAEEATYKAPGADFRVAAE